jgi:hypothetical protein
MNIEKEYTKFVHYTIGDSHYPEKKWEVTIDPHSTLNEIIEQFENFLRGIGYVFDGKLEIIKEDENNY